LTLEDTRKAGKTKGQDAPSFVDEDRVRKSSQKKAKIGEKLLSFVFMPNNCLK
jgi:hypothetical protein